MTNLFLYIVWGIFVTISIWGFISLFTLAEISNNAWTKQHALRMSTLKRYVTTYKAGIKALLFHFGLTYLEVRDTKIVYFIFSMVAVGISLIFWLVIKTSSWIFWFSSSFLFLNFVFYFGAKYDMKKFYAGDKLPKDVFMGGSFQKQKKETEKETLWVNPKKVFGEMPDFPEID